MVKAGYIGGKKESLLRKLNYESELASVEGINLSMLRWGAILDNILTNISFNLLFNFNLALHLCLNMNFDPSQFDFNMPDFYNAFNIKFERIEKAKYGISKYGQALYDPPGITFRDLARMVWDLRYKTTCEDALSYKQTGKALLNWIDNVKQSLINLGVSEQYFEGIIRQLSLVEGKLLTTSYFDFAAFDVSVFSYEYNNKNVVFVRNIANWNELNVLETVGIYECHFDNSKFDYAHFVEDYGKNGIYVKKDVCDNFENRVKEFHARSGQFEEHGVKGLFQRVFFLERKDRMKWNGGKHQVKLQQVINEVKRILNEMGVIAQFRGAYIAFAQELLYKDYNPHRRYKRWKQILSDEDLIRKYINMGCDKNILNKIKEVVVRWR